jgi:zinc/manganese transport system substrate-binding protein
MNLFPRSSAQDATLRGLNRLAGTILVALATVALVGAGGGAASAKIRVAASITDLASIASSVGGDQVECFSISRPTSDVHHVEVLPSYMVRVARADVYLKVGLALDQWADQIIDGSRNDRLVVVDCSRDIDALEKPTGQVSAAMGDVHPNGNPHYWLDPRNGAVVAREVAEALFRVDPGHAADYQSRAEAFAKEIDGVMAKGQQAVSALPVKVILTYHSSWVYLAHAFGLEIAGTAEPVPGIPPTGKHLQDLVDLIKQRKIPFLLQEPYFSDDAGQFLVREAGIRVVKASPSCDTAEAGSYLDHIGQVLQMMTANSSGPAGS